MSIQRTLQLWLLGGATLCTLITGMLTYAVMHDEANELFDRQLRQLAVTVPHDIKTSTLNVADDETEDDIVVQVWNSTGHLIYIAPKGIVLPHSRKLGYSDIDFHDQKWRVFAKIHNGNYVQASQPFDTRDELSGQMALGATAPFLLLIPALLILIWFVIRRGLQPLTQVVRAVEDRSMDSLQSISVENTPPEIQPLLNALNDLLSRLDKAWSVQRNFVADAAHELRSPLTALKLQLQRAEKTTDKEQRAIAYTKLHERLDRTVHVVQQLLTLARQEPQCATPENIENADIVTSASASIAQLAPLAEAKHIDLGLDNLIEPIIVRVPSESLEVMLDNLIDNAIRYTPSGGKISVIIRENSGKTELIVSDDGLGIPVEDRNRVFDRFYRREGTGVIGSGLGLAIVKTIADRYCIDLNLSESDGGGTQISMIFNS